MSSGGPLWRPTTANIALDVMHVIFGLMSLEVYQNQTAAYIAIPIGPLPKPHQVDKDPGQPVSLPRTLGTPT